MLPDYRTADKLYKMQQSKRHKFSRDELQTLARAVLVLEAVHDMANLLDYSVPKGL